MRIAVNGRFLLQDVTGVQRVGLEFVRALDELLAEGARPGLQADLWLPRSGDLVSDLPLRAVRLRRGGRLSGHAWEQLELPRLASGVPLLCLGNVAPVLRLLRRRPATSVMVHDLSYRYFPQAYSRAFRAVYSVLVPLALARAAHVVTVSESERAAITQHYPRLVGDRLTAVQNGGGEPSSERDDDTARERSVLYVGSLTRRKNAEGLVAAAVRLAREDGVGTTFVGSTGASFESTGVHVPDEVRSLLTFRGQVNDPTALDEEYRRAGCLLFPSFYEASPLPPVEAQSRGCPVVAADIPSLRERCGDGASYCDPADVESIVSAVRGVLDDPAHARALQDEGWRSAARYSWRRQAETVLDLVVTP